MSGFFLGFNIFFLFHRISGAHLSPYSNDLLNGLFGTLSVAGSTENEYVMKGIWFFFFIKKLK